MRYPESSCAEHDPELRLAQIKTRRLEILSVLTEWRRAYYVDGIKTPMDERLTLQAEQARLDLEFDAIKSAAERAKHQRRADVKAERDHLLTVLERLVKQVETGFFDYISHEHEASAIHAARAAIEQAVKP
jgi:hypothetical protein